MDDENIKNKNGLSVVQKNVIKEVLRPFAHQIDRVGVLGSRATGNYRHNSDIDIVIYGDLSETDINRLWTLFDESALSITVDINVYSHITYAPLKEHIDQFMQPLFYKKELLASATV